jgi:hypothetical protein
VHEEFGSLLCFHSSAEELSPASLPVRRHDDIFREEETMSTVRPADWVELAKRASNGVEVVLLWSRTSQRVKVAVSDERICHHLDFDVAGGNALRAFYDSFAIASSDVRVGRVGPP